MSMLSANRDQGEFQQALPAHLRSSSRSVAGTVCGSGAAGSSRRPEHQALVLEEAKECRRCHRVLDAEAFPPAKQNSDGRNSYCRTCKTEARREWGANNPERRNEIQREYWARKTAEAKG